jgi:PAS domain S-box-containing protein
MPQAAATLTGEGTVLSCNRPFAGLLGQPLQDLPGASAHAFISPATRPAFAALLLGAREGGAQREVTLRRADGTDVTVHLGAHLLREGAAGQCLVVIDLTSQKRHEALVTADRHKDEFLAMLSHELRNPLAPLHHIAQFLQTRSSPDPDVRRCYEVLDRQVGHLARLVDDLLDVSRIGRGKISLRKEPVRLAAVVESAVETSRPPVEAGRHELTVELPPEQVWLEADPTRLTQAVANLVNNAAKYTAPGSRIWVTARRERDEAVVRVRDTGVGIPAEMLDRVFEPFAQVDRSLTRSQGGLGIGRTLVKSLVDMHGGAVRAASAGLGRGERVRASAARRPGAPGCPSGHTRRATPCPGSGGPAPGAGGR